MTYKSDAFMVPSSNRLGNGPLKAEMRVRTSLESPLGKECYLAKQLHSHGANIVVTERLNRGLDFFTAVSQT